MEYLLWDSNRLNKFIYSSSILPPLYPAPDTIRPSSPLLTETTTTKAHTLSYRQGPPMSAAMLTGISPLHEFSLTLRVALRATTEHESRKNWRVGYNDTEITFKAKQTSEWRTHARTRARGGIIVRYNRSSSSAARMAFTPR